MTTVFDRPFALFIGPQECGTDILNHYFSSRSDICLPDTVEETFFFDRHYHRGPAFYQNHFQPQPDQALVMEITTTIFDSTDAPTHVQDILGADTKLICPLRHPVYRAYTAYQHYLEYGIVSGDLEQAIEQAPQIIHASRYAKHLTRWFDVFDKDSIKIIFAEALEADAAFTLTDLCEYLGIAYTKMPDINASTTPVLDRKMYSLLTNLKQKLSKEKSAGRSKQPIKRAQPTDQDIKILHARLSEDMAAFTQLTGLSFPTMPTHQTSAE